MSQKRSIFEEVGQAGAAPAPRGGMIDQRPKGARAAIRLWLFVLFALVVVMIGVGGATRLSDAGLSITEWKPVTGALPPMSEADWQAEFQKYQQIPQFTLQNPNMTLPEFKGIYWWEWGHRQLGRVIGLVWAAGFLGFWVTKRIPKGWAPRLLGLGVLGGLQGAIGWWMVASGLEGKMTSVASYRLAIHLGLAFAILGLIASYAFTLARSESDLMQSRRVGEPALAGLATGVRHLAFVQILLGALTAGIDAGRGYIDWPLMGGEFFPSEAFAYTPLWTNFFENPALVQFIHRMAGYLLLAFGLFVAFRGRRSAHAVTQTAFAWVGAMLLLQVALGIVTVMHAAPMGLGLAHQLGAVVLWVLTIRAQHLARTPVVQSIRGSK
ncbi:heme A synthase [Sedimentimonas flavescens]|uniref:heme A synthase n=1 Tax=Sedimentimonas flavescens TaxID=2851012 RepID=UPI0021A8CE2E|nr:heme A synthase [Sedimentimonas flavescens]MCT2540647.1 COX15/CtaA family protein [Sedimentimonas flavescens]